LAASSFTNCYQDVTRAEAYARLGFERTYYLAYRDLPAIFREHARGTAALDFGCGTGRSTRFLRQCGFEAVGVDISEDMLRKAHEVDPTGDYRLVINDDFSAFPEATFDVVLSAFTFDNIPGADKLRIFRELRRLLRPDGILVNVVSSPAIYLHEWASFSTLNFVAENRRAASGDRVRIITLDHGDHRPVEDILCADESYREIYEQVGLAVAAKYEPLADGTEPYEWITETTIAPWVIYVLKR
jgi:ubiquinone/menaquinone biosynthesis C-methylase UbiE